MCFHFPCCFSSLYYHRLRVFWVLYSGLNFSFQSRVMILNMLIPVVSLCIAIKPSVWLWSVCVPAAWRVYPLATFHGFGVGCSDRPLRSHMLLRTLGQNGSQSVRWMYSSSKFLSAISHRVVMSVRSVIVTEYKYLTRTLGLKRNWVNKKFPNLTFIGPCIVICSSNKSQQAALFLTFILVKNSTCFGHTYCPSY